MTVDRELLGSALPAYDIGDVLGQGGWGQVVSGQHRQLDRQVAIKQLPANLASDPAVRRRFTAEARVLASLDHPHVVPVFDFVERDGVCLLVMELLPGGTLRSRVTVAGGFAAPHAVAVSLACATVAPAQPRETAAASTAGAARKPMDPARRRRLIISWVIVAVLVIAAIVIFVVVKPLHTYG
jgi:hypothetical protein